MLTRTDRCFAFLLALLFLVLFLQEHLVGIFENSCCFYVISTTDKGVVKTAVTSVTPTISTKRSIRKDINAGAACLKSPVRDLNGPINHNLQLVSAYSRAYGDEPAFTNFTGTFRGCLDYIFSSPELELKKVGELADHNEASQLTAYPCKSWPSDHLLLSAVYRPIYPDAPPC